MKSILLCIVALIEFGAAAQTRTHGKILADSAGHSYGIPGVRVKIPAWKVETITDSTGTFYFQMVASDAVKIIAYFGNNDSSEFTFDPAKQPFPVLVRPLSSLPPITVNAVRSTWKIAAKGIRKSEILGEGEFKKAACCTLGESFETTNAVEVSNSDGVSGIRHVEMLGLAGKYMNITRNNLPFLRGFAQLNGLNQIPGPMVSGVSIAKGAGSVSGGFEGLTGSIDYGLKAEPNDPVLFLNAFGNSQRRYEGNLVSTQKINRQFQNHTYLHYGQQQHVTDKGGDGLSDMPEFQRYFVSDQLNYHFKMAEGMTGFSHTNESRKGGAT